MEEGEYARINEELNDGSKICRTYDWLFNYDIFS
jgi:hypothetical protein